MSCKQCYGTFYILTLLYDVENTDHTVKGRYFLVERRLVAAFGEARPLVGRRLAAGALAIISLAWS
jgi:hypothetical protein